MTVGKKSFFETSIVFKLWLVKEIFQFNFFKYLFNLIAMLEKINKKIEFWQVVT